MVTYQNNIVPDLMSQSLATKFATLVAVISQMLVFEMISHQFGIQKSYEIGCNPDQSHSSIQSSFIVPEGQFKKFMLTYHIFPHEFFSFFISSGLCSSLGTYPKTIKMEDMIT